MMLTVRINCLQHWHTVVFSLELVIITICNITNINCEMPHVIKGFFIFVTLLKESVQTVMTGSQDLIDIFNSSS